MKIGTLSTCLLLVSFTLALLGCNPKVGFTPDFSASLQEKLRYTRETFKPNNRAFILNVKEGPYTILQIVHRSYAEQTRHKDDSFGFALQVTFPSQPREMRAYQNFKASTLSSGFIAYKYEHTPCYVIDLGDDIAKAQSLTEQLLIDVYDINDIQRLTAELSDEGEVSKWVKE